MAYRLSRRADDDLLDIYVTGIGRFGVEQSETFAAGLKRAFAFLADFPRAARERLEIDPPVRAYPYKSHLIVYVIEDDDILTIRIAHGRQDWPNESDSVAKD